MSIENLAFVKKNSKLTDIFTKHINIIITEKNGIIDFNINNVAHILVKNPQHNTSKQLSSNQTNSNQSLLKGGIKHKNNDKKLKKSKTHKNSKIYNNPKKNKKQKTSKKRTLKNKKKSKKLHQKGGGFKSIILLILVNYFMFNFITSIQIAQNPQNYLETEQSFFEQNPLTHPNIRSLFDSVEDISINNKTNITTGEVLQIIDMDGVVMEQENTDIGEDFETAFAEVKYDDNSFTQKFLKLATKLPHIKRPIVSVMSASLNARARYYGIFAKWKIENNDISIQLFNVTNQDGNYPDDRARNFPNDTNLNTLARQTIKEQVKTMIQTKLLRTGENSGFATVGAFSFPIYPALFTSEDFHQDGMSWITPTKTANDPEKTLQENIKRSIGNPVFKNSTFSRTNIFDQVMTMTYPKDVSIESGSMIYNTDGNKTLTLPINITKGQSTTRMLNQYRGAQHSRISQSMFDIHNLPKSRSALLVNVMPDKNFILDQNLTYTVRN